MMVRVRVEYGTTPGLPMAAEVEWADSPGIAPVLGVLGRMLRTQDVPQPVRALVADLPPVDDLRDPSGVLCRRYICQHPRDVHTKDGCEVCDAPGKCPEYVGLSETVLP